ncbi:MAG: DUF2142 domain-containing protein [Cryobacterium sp.]|nr:DUF2142 domain-containing protein [Cryobacterium sp.]
MAGSVISSKAPGNKIFSRRVMYLAPFLAFLALAAWAFASPVGASPDDDYHLISIWCANGGSDECQPGLDESSRSVDTRFAQVVCFAFKPDESAACQTPGWDSTGRFETSRGNFSGVYPPLYYATMHFFAGHDIQASAVTMRLINAALFVALSTALYLLLPSSRRRTLLWGWLISVVPLGVFIIPSNNPSSWAIIGVGSAFLALVGWFESRGRRVWAFGAIYLVGMLMASGARADAAVFASGATLVAAIFTYSSGRRWGKSSILPLIGIAIAVYFVVSSTQFGIGVNGFTGTAATSSSGSDGAPADGVVGPALAVYNLLMVPFLWAGVWGTWGLGWLDTSMPAVVSWASVAVFIVVAFAGLGKVDWRKAIGVSGVLIVLVALPVYVLTAGGDKVGSEVQPRYLLPLIVLLSLALVTMPGRSEFRFTRIQLFAIVSALTLANVVALQVNLRRYLTGVDKQGLNLDSGSEWWWSGSPVGPIWIWTVGSLAFAGLLTVLWAQLRTGEGSEGSTESGLAPLPLDLGGEKSAAQK